MDAGAIRASGLTKTFGGNVAVDQLDLDVAPGELFGLVGPDGAGKTTIMRLLSGILSPTTGEAWVAGRSILRDPEAIKEEIGYMSQRFGLYEDLTVMENILFYADMYSVPRRERPPRIERLLGFSKLAPFKDRLAGNLSGGMKQKLGLACALIHTPRVLFLDEPTGGVDPVSRRDLWRILYDLLREGVTIFVSTAYLDEAERCTRIGLIDRGRLLVTGEPREVRTMLHLPMVEILTPSGGRARTVATAVDGVRSVTAYGDRLHVGLERPDVAAAVVSAMTAAGIEIGEQRPILPSLEDIFIALVTGPEDGAKKRQDG
ncbi:MAG: ABC transporter ATP-binding protein [Syntrophorhabdales bacterium]|jgi:ABC-2 type transport system ATP-binding protein